MNRCWAAPLGNCSDKMSREHIVTAGTFVDDEVWVQGFHWCKDAPVKIGLAGLTAKILCEKHNSELSSVDDAGIETVQQFREFFRLAYVRNHMRPRYWNKFRARIDGIELERWYLKTLINIAFGRAFPTFKPDKAVRWEPSRELVEIAFGIRRFQSGAGLYFSNRIGQNIDPDSKFTITTFTNQDDELTGARFIHFGFHFVLNIDSKRLQNKISFVSGGNVTETFDLNYRMGAFQYSLDRKHISHILEIMWPEKGVAIAAKAATQN